jgi:hypothetical protein
MRQEDLRIQPELRRRRFWPEPPEHSGGMDDAGRARQIVRKLWPRFGDALLTVCAMAAASSAPSGLAT